jgi:hypothetical protein
MKKNIIIFCTSLVTLCLTAFGFMSLNNSETDQAHTLVSKDMAVNKPIIEKIDKKIATKFIYDVGPRFGPIKKGDLDKAKSFSDFIDEEHAQQIVSYKSMSIIIIKDDEQSNIRETGNSGVLTAAQIKFLQSLDYSTNILVRADYTEKNKESGKLESSYATPHLTIVPEKQAEYASGKEALIEFLEEGIKEYTAFIQPDQLQPAKLYFTVTKKGKLENIKLDRSSNFPEIDETMIELISKAPGEWVPAENSKGEKVDQELVISYGLMGC